jgi:protein TonB
LLPVITLVIWLACLVIGLVGLLIPSGTPAGAPAATSQPAADAPETLNVDVTNLPLPPLDADQTPAPVETADAAEQPPDAAAPAGPPPMLAALASPDIAFEKPVSGPVRIVSAALAARNSAPASTAASTVQAAIPLSRRTNPSRIVYGRGEGVQPAPQYPIEAVLDHEQGTVVVRFTVNPQGIVDNAEAFLPCPWPLLNQAAVRAVLETWRFSAGRARFYEVSIHFGLRRE